MEEREDDSWPDKNRSGSCSGGVFPDCRGKAEDALQADGKTPAEVYAR